MLAPIALTQIFARTGRGCSAAAVVVAATAKFDRSRLVSLLARVTDRSAALPGFASDAAADVVGAGAVPEWAVQCHGSEWLRWRALLPSYLPSADSLRNSVALEAVADRAVMTPLSGGNSNFVYKLALRADAAATTDGVPLPLPPPLVVRVYGGTSTPASASSSAWLVDREAETRVACACAARGVAPLVLATFDWGRVEIFLDGFAEATVDTLLADAKLRRRVIAEMHALHARRGASADHLESGPTLFATLQRWHGVARRGVAMRQRERFDASIGAATALLEALLGAGSETAPAPRATVDRVCPSPVVFCHNDLNPGNVMYRNDDGGDNTAAAATVRLLDFEYAASSYRAFDLGNHLCEYNFRYTPSTAGDVAPMGDGGRGFWTTFPTTHARGLLAVAARRVSLDAADAHTKLVHELLECYREEAAAAVSGASAPTAEELTVEYFVGVLASHVHWGLWAAALVASEVGPSDGDAADDDDGQCARPRGSSGLDYLAFGEFRFEQMALLLRDLCDAHANAELFEGLQAAAPKVARLVAVVAAHVAASAPSAPVS